MKAARALERSERKRHHAASPMTADRYRRLLGKLGLSQLGAGRFLGYSPSQAARIAAGTAAVPPAVAMLLEVLAAHDISPDDALVLIGVNVNKAKREAKSEQVNKAPRFFRE